MYEDWFPSSIDATQEKMETVGMTPKVVEFVNRTCGIPLDSAVGSWDERTLKTAEKVVVLDPEYFVDLNALSLHLALPSLTLEFLSGNALRYFSSCDPEMKKTLVLLLDRAGKDGVDLLKDYQTSGEILSQTEPSVYMEWRLSLAERVKKLGVAQGVMANLLTLDERKILSVERLPDSGHRDLYAAFLIERNIDENELLTRVMSWERIMTPQLWEYTIGPEGQGLKNLIKESRSSWIEALEGIAGTQDLREMLFSPKAVESFLTGNAGAKLADKSQDRESEYGYFAERGIMPMSSVDARATEELRDIMEACGLAELIKNIVCSIKLTIKDEMRSASGLWFRESLTMELAVDVKRKQDLPGILFHELGHAVECRLANVFGAQRVFDRYAVKLIYTGMTASSNYAEACAKLKNREDRNSISESFAEDFRIMLQNPDALPESKLVPLKELFAMLAPGKDLENIQQKIRKMYGNFYGADVKDAKCPIDCSLVVKMADFLDRRSGAD